MATSISPYVTLDGNCEEAVKFWAGVLKFEYTLMRMGESPMPVPPEAKNRILHAAIRGDGFLLMASDGMMGQPVPKGGPVSLALNFTSKEEQDRVWAGLSEGGSVTMPLGEQFWGRFGMLTDKFGIHWMLSLEAPKS